MILRLCPVLLLLPMLSMIGLTSAHARQQQEAACPRIFEDEDRQDWQEQTPCLEALVRDRVEVRRDPGLFRNGQGFYVGDGSFVLTTAHVIAGCQAFTVTLSTGEERSAGLVSWDARRDVAVLRPEHGSFSMRTDRPPGLSLSFSPPNTPIGAVRVATLDLLNKQQSVPDMLVRNASPPNAAPLGPSKSLVLEGQPLNLGTSGAPVLNNSGEVVGMVTANVPLGGGPSSGGPKLLTIATPAAQLDEVLAVASSDSWVGASVRNIDDQPQSIQNNLVRIRCR